MSRKTSWRPCALVVALSLVWPMCATARPAAPPSLADMTLEELSSVEITSASKRAQALSDAATSIYVITADDIRRSGATNLPEALRLAPNLFVAEVNNYSYSITSRGFGSRSPNKLQVLIDGRSVYTPLFGGVFWDVQDVMLQDVERIEVISGPGGTLWGVNAVNGVINVITRSSHNTQGTLAVAGVSDQGNNAAARYGGTLGADGHYRLFAQYSDSRNTQTNSGKDVDDAGHMSQVGFRADWTLVRDEVMLEANVQEGKHGQPSPGSLTIAGVPIKLGDITTKGMNAVGKWVRKLSDGAEFSLIGYLDHTERVVIPTFSENLDISDVQMQYTFPPSQTQAWTVGGEYRVSQDRLVNSQYLGFQPPDVDQNWAALFAQDDLTLRRDLHLILGLRYESNDYTGWEWLPNARLAWKVAPDHLLWTALSRTTRAPTRLDRDTYVPWPSNFGPGPEYLLAGGAEVQSEVARVFEIGYRGQPTPKTNISLTWYRSLYEKLLTQELSPERDHYTYESNMDASVDGIEVWGGYQPYPSWRLSAGFSGMYQRFALDPGSTDKAGLTAAQGRDPARTWQVRSAWDLPHATELDITARYVSALQDPEVPPYLAFDMRWGWHVRPGLDLSVTGRNLFGSHGEYMSIVTRTEISPSLYVQAVVQF